MEIKMLDNKDNAISQNTDASAGISPAVNAVEEPRIPPHRQYLARLSSFNRKYWIITAIDIAIALAAVALAIFNSLIFGIVLAIFCAVFYWRLVTDEAFNTLIPRNVRLSEAPSHGKPVMYYDRGSRGSKCYEELAKYIIAANA